MYNIFTKNKLKKKLFFMFEFLNEVLFIKLFLRIIFNFFKIVFETVAKWTRLFQIFVYCCNTNLHKLPACN